MKDLFVADLTKVSLEKMIESKVEVFIRQQKEANTVVEDLLSSTLEKVEPPLIQVVLRSSFGDLNSASKMLGISAELLIEKMNKYGIKNDRT